MAKEIIVSKLNRCDELIGRKSVAMTFYNIGTDIERRKPNIHYMSGEEEARECNRQFYEMIDDNDAWSNLD